MVRVEITLEFDERPDKADVYNYLLELIDDRSLRYDVEGELDSQLKEKEDERV